MPMPQAYETLLVNRLSKSYMNIETSGRLSQIMNLQQQEE